MNARVALVVAGQEFRRTLRVVLGDRTKLLVVGALAAFGLLVTSLGAVLTSIVGSEAAAGNVEAFEEIGVLEVATGATALVWLGLALLATIRTATTVADLDEPAFLLVSASPREVVVGSIGAEVLRLGVWILVPAMILAGGFAYGAGTALPLVVVPALVAMVLVSAIAVGYVPGIWIRHLVTVYEPVARYRTILLIGLGVGYVLAITQGWLDAAMVVVFETLGNSPLGWPGHVLALGIPHVAPSTELLVAALVWTGLLVPAAVAVGVASARIHWFADPARTDDGGPTVRKTESGRFGIDLEGLLAVAFDRRVRTVAVTAIRRTRRAPVRLLYVAYPLFGAMFFVEDVAAGTIPTALAVLCCLYVVWGSGALFALNPLGDLGRSLPAVVTSTVPGRSVVVGLVAASALLTVPIALAVSIAVGLASPLSLEYTALAAAGTVVGAVAAPALATGVGSAFPRFGSVRITSNREAVMPSKTAFLVYSVAIMAPAGAAAVLASDGATDLLAFVFEALLSLVIDASVPASAVAAIAWIVLPLGLVAPPVAAWYAARRFDRYELG